MAAMFKGFKLLLCVLQATVLISICKLLFS